jgi:hypothetical protein
MKYRGVFADLDEALGTCDHGRDLEAHAGLRNVGVPCS